MPLAIGLRRDLASRQIQFLAIGAAIGSGLFVGSAQALRAAGPGLLIAYAVCAVPVYLIARCLGEMTLAFPGQATFVDQVRGQLGARAGLICGWTFWLSLVLIGMAELTAIGLLVHGWIEDAPRWLVVTASLAAPLLFNLAPVRRFGTIEVWISALKVLTITLFIALGLLAALPGHLGLAGAGLSNLWRPGGLLPTGWSGLVEVLPVALFSFGGFEMVSLAASEAADPDRAVPSAVNGLIVRFVIFYLGGIAALLVLLPWTRIVPGVSPFVVVLQRLSFPSASILLDIVLISAVSSSCSALLFAASRTLRALAGAAGAPAIMADLTAQAVPRNAVLFSAAAISLAILLNGLIPREAFGLLMRMVSIATLANWSLIVLAQMASRRRTPGRPQFAVPFSPWSNCLVLAFIATMLILVAVP